MATHLLSKVCIIGDRQWCPLFSPRQPFDILGTRAKGLLLLQRWLACHRHRCCCIWCCCWLARCTAFLVSRQLQRELEAIVGLICWQR
jgi:hypothetical protein